MSGISNAYLVGGTVVALLAFCAHFKVSRSFNRNAVKHWPFWRMSISVIAVGAVAGVAITAML